MLYLFYGRGREARRRTIAIKLKKRESLGERLNKVEVALDEHKYDQ